MCCYSALLSQGWTVWVTPIGNVALGFDHYPLHRITAQMGPATTTIAFMSTPHGSDDKEVLDS